MQILTLQAFQNESRDHPALTEQDFEFDRTVLRIIEEVRKSGDPALRSYTEQFDGIFLDSLLVTEEEFVEAEQLVSSTFKRAMAIAQENISNFHREQKEKSWLLTTANGTMLGQQVTPLDSVGIYVPGGKAAYPSTVLMNALPAQIAGVQRIVMVTPPQANGTINPHVLYAAKLAGVHKVYKVGGAQAIAALAYGTETIAKVAKITGPGNAYVARAKKWVYGDVAIDMIAGPSEICVVADDTANPAYVAADLLSQAEHDERARAICITTSEAFAVALQQEVLSQLASADRQAIMEQSITNNGRILLVETLEEAFQFVNELAPEHLQVMVTNPLEKLPLIRNAGAIFLGSYSPEALGDYAAGPNHTLPTSGTAAFSSPLGVYDFMKKSSIIHFSKEAFHEVADAVITIAEAEGLTAHAESIRIRKVEDNA